MSKRSIPRWSIAALLMLPAFGADIWMRFVLGFISFTRSRLHLSLHT